MTTLRLVWPQWQGAASSNDSLVSDLPSGIGRSSYSYGTRVLDALLETPHAVTAHVDVQTHEDREIADGIESKAIVLDHLRSALEAIEHYDPDRILTIGGDCSVSLAPFAAMARQYGDDLAIIWVDSHPDLDTPETNYSGFHAMVLSHLIGKGDTETLELLPASVDPARVAIAGLHSWTDDVSPHIEKWGIASFSPTELRETPGSLLDWLNASGCTKVAIHFDVDVVDSSDIVLGLGAEVNGLTLAEASQLVRDIGEVADVVALTVAEYIPRQVIRLVDALRDFPLIG